MSERCHIGARHLRVLRRICDKLGDGDVTWAVSAGMNLALQGVPVQAHDIDLRTDAAGAFEIERRLATFVVRRVQFSVGDRIRSLFGALRIDDITVEIIGDAETLRDDGTWESSEGWAERRVFLELGSNLVPVLPLDLEHQMYGRLGRADKVEVLARWFSQQGRRTDL